MGFRRSKKEQHQVLLLQTSNNNYGWNKYHAGIFGEVNSTPYPCKSKFQSEVWDNWNLIFQLTSKKIDKDMGFRLKKARLDQKLTYDELSEKSGVSSRYIKEIENHGNVPSLEKLGQLIRALHISADPFFYPAAPTDNLDYQRLLVYLSECTDDQITTILALVEAYLRTYKTHETE